MAEEKARMGEKGLKQGSKTPNLQALPTPQEGEGDIRAEDVVTYVRAYLKTLPRGKERGKIGWEEILEGYRSLVERWNQEMIPMESLLPLLLEAGVQLAEAFQADRGRLLGAISDLVLEQRQEKPPASHPTAERIRIAAYQVFAAKGFYQATVEEIAQSARVGKGTVYRYFESKENLFRAVVEDRLRELVCRIRDAFIHAEDVLGAIRRAILEYFRFFEEHQEFYRILVYEQQGFGAEFRAGYIDGILQNVPVIR
ncbi:MAG: TetR/AcrR family transcriptional regulator, partial [Deltaproteobacteria bacterium]